MDRQDILAGTRDLSEKLSPRPRGLRRIPVEDRRPIGLATLQGVVHEVADHDRVLSARADIDAAMAGRMAGRRHEPKRIVELIAVIDEQRLAGFDDGPHPLRPTNFRHKHVRALRANAATRH